MTEPKSPSRLSELLVGYWFTQSIYVAAKLGLAERLKNGARSVADLAAETGTHEKSLFRLLRALASLGLFKEEESRTFALTPDAELLRPDVPGSQWAMAVMIGEEHYRAWGELLDSVRTGQTAFDKIYKKPLFEYLSEHPQQAAVFDRAMVAVHGRETAAILDAYDFSAFKTVTDVGGGNGSMLCGLLGRYPNLHGTLYDLPGVIGRAGANVDAAGLANRVHLVAGDFFESVPAGADVYLLRHIIHDWDDEKSVRILENVHRALDGRGRVLVIESVIPPGNEPFFGKLLDLAMLVGPGGQERTPDEYRDLFGKAGFRIARIVPTLAEVSVVVGTPE
jgi:hypothetical protein